MEVAAHGQGGGADGATEVEGEDLTRPRMALVAAKLQGHEGQEHALARAGRAHDQGVAHVPDVQGEAEGGRSLGLGEEQWSAAQMVVPLRPGPDRGDRDHMGQVQGRDWRLADVGVGVARQRPQPGVDRIDAFHHAGEVAALQGLLHLPKARIGHRWVGIPDADRRGDIGVAHEVSAQVL